MNTKMLKYNLWLGGDKIEGARFLHNSYVKVVSGDNEGVTGSVVSLVFVQEGTKYIIELESGFDIEVYENEIIELESQA